MADYYLNHTASEINAILTKVDGIAAGANVNVQVDWNQTTPTADNYIKNKPTLGSAAAKDYTTAVSGLSDDLITSSAVNATLATKADKATTYTKTEIDSMIGDINTVLEEVL